MTIGEFGNSVASHQSLEKVSNMDFDLSEEQRLLKESVDGLLNDSYDFDSRKKYRAEKGGWSKAVWGKLAEQGLLGLPFSEDDGGFGAGAVETMIVMEALGKALLLEPYLATVVIGGGFLRRGGSAAQKAAHIPGIIDGSKTFAFAQLEKSSRYDLQDVATTAKKKGDGWVIDGEKFVVLNGENADTFIVTARTKGGQRDASGIGVFLVPAGAKGITKKGYPTQDGLHAADVTFTGVEVGADAAIGDPENGLALIERVVDDARIALCAEAVGAMDESLKTTVEYLKTRTQFGVPIGSFQTLQHRAADMFVAVEQARSMSMFATMASDFDDAKERATAVAAAKVQIGKSAKFVGQQAIQLHGGIGMTQEAKIGHYFKRLTMIENTFGDTDYHLRRVTEGGGLVIVSPSFLRIVRTYRNTSARAHRSAGRHCRERVLSDPFLLSRVGMDCFAALAMTNDKSQVNKQAMKNTPFDLTGKVAVVTGSSRGIGRSSAELLAKLGAKVVISSRKADACAEVADGIRQAGGDAHVIPCNISRREEVEALISGTTKHYGKIDILVCNAAVNPYYGPLLDIKDEAFDKIMNSNVKSNIWLCALAIPQMAERGNGSVVIVSSIGGLRGSTVIGAYGISKAADFALCRSLAGEWGPQGVRVNCVAPGLVKTDFAKALWEDEERLKRRCATTPLRRIGEPDEIAGAVAYLGSDASSFMTGQTIVVDGGVTTASV